MVLQRLVNGLFRFLEELARIGELYDRHPPRRESPHDALRTAARRLGLDHARGRVWGELKMFVSAGLVEGSWNCLVVARFRRPLGLGLELLGANTSRPESSATLRPVALKSAVAGKLRAHAREPDIVGRLLAQREIIRSLQALTSEGILTIDDERVELMLEPRAISSRAVVIALREASSLAYELRRQRTEFPRSDHEIPVRNAWSQQASARGGHFDSASEVLTFDSVAGEIRLSVEREDDSRLHGWRTNILLTFKRPLTLGPREARPALNQLEMLTNQVELEARHLRALVTHPIHDPDELAKILDALVAAGAAIEHEAESGHAAYR